MQVCLVQHGEAVAKEIDADRPLSPQGEADVAGMAKFLKGVVTVNKILHSGKTRARQTAEILANAVLKEGDIIAVSDINPNDPVDEYVTQMNEWTEDTLIVGHLPFMAKLVAQLVIKNESNVITVFQPGSIVCLARDEDSNWQILWMLRPELLEK